ncbi:ligand-binding sensor domain-containing protein [Enterovibrio coralii]|nr:hypothetical protein [Enterovibrio coralii]
MAYIEENGIWLLDDAGQVSFYDGTYIQSLSDFVPDVPPVSDLGVVDNTLLLLIDKKLHLYDMASGEVTVSYFASGLDINDIEVWSNDLLVASTTGVYRLDLRNERVEHVHDAVLARIYRVDSGFIGDTGSQLIELNSGKTLYRYSGTQPISDVEVWDNKLLVGNNGGIHVIRGDTITQSFFRDERVFAIEKTGEGIWVGTDAGIYLAKSEGEELHFAQMNKTSIDTFSFLGKKVTAFAKGLEGDMWIASENGLNYRSSILSGLHRLPVGHLNGEMADAGVSSFINGYGNFYISARNKLVKLSNTLEPIKAKTFNFSIQSLAALENTIWVASASGLYAYHPDSLEKQSDALPEALRNIPIDKLLADSHSLWISSENRILRYWPKTQTLIDFDTWWSDSQEARLLSLLDLDEDGIWLGTTHGLIRYFDGSFNNVLSHEEMGAVKALSVGSNDLIWMVASQGVYRYAIDDKAKPVQVLDHSENGRILCASTQNNAITYITTKGVFRNHRGQTLKQSVLTTHLTSQSVRYFCDMSAQATYFAGDLGAFYLSTETLNKLFNLPLRPSFVSTVYVDKQPYRLGPVGESVVVSMPAKSTATIDISQMPFNVREGVTYQLLGSGSDTWHTTKDNHLVFSALDSGDYSS